MLLEIRSGDVSSMPWGYEGRLSPGRTVLLASRPAHPAAPPPRRAPRRDPPVVCPGFDETGINKSRTHLGVHHLLMLAQLPRFALLQLKCSSLLLSELTAPEEHSLIDVWCSEDNPFGKTGDDSTPARNVVLFTVQKVLSREQTILDAFEEVGKHKSTNLHRSLPRTPWSS